ncbi:hypothetical protein [Pseudoalteromonas ruthenica]|nr:hypothetical protein [Pseudoalteromonas ruthenica]
MRNYAFILLILASFCLRAADFGNLASMDERLIEQQARDFVENKYTGVEPKKLVLFGIRLNFSRLIEVDSELVATFINLSARESGQPVERIVPSPNKPNEKVKVVFTQYQTIELTFNKTGTVIRLNKHQEIYPDPPAVFNKMVSEL